MMQIGTSTLYTYAFFIRRTYSWRRENMTGETTQWQNLGNSIKR